MSSQIPVPIPPNPPDLHDPSRIQAHLAEYAMLTTKVTYSVAFCAAVWGLIAGYLALMVNMATKLKSSSLLQWASVLAIEIMLAWIATFIVDAYVTVLYIETELSPQLAPYLGQNRPFWRWERFLAKRRGKHLPFFWEWPMTICSGVAITVNLIWRFMFGWTWWDVLVIPAFALLYFNAALARQIQRTREEWTQFNITWERRFNSSRADGEK